MRVYIVNIFLLLFLGVFQCYSQNIDKLRKERESLLEEIANTSSLIKEKKENRQNNLRELNLIERNIRTQEKLLDNYENEISQLDNQIEVNQMLVNDLERDISELKNEYSRLLRNSYKRKGDLNEILFLFSAKDFSEAYMRYRLFKEYGRYRQQQGEELIRSQNEFEGLLRQIKHQKNDKEEVLAKIESEINNLEDNRDRKKKLVQRLNTEQQWLQDSLKEKEKAADELENKIRELIAAQKDDNVDEVVSGNFSERMGKLTWPVEDGVIVNSFGEQRHPILKDVTIKNNGIDIQSSGSSDVFSVHSGVVSTIVAIPGLNKAIIIRHGKFLTVYGNLIDVFVSKNDNVSAGDRIGKIYHDDSEMKEVLHFEIWEENTKLDPEQWLLH
ncbi:MAG: murein hydrolase activator EnvC family protein [bacterium]